MKKNISSRFKIEYNDMFQNYKDNLYLNNTNNSNNNLVFMQTKMNKNISSSKLELLKQKYFIKEKFKKEKLLFLNTMEEKSILINSDIKYDSKEANEIFDIAIDLQVINLSEEVINNEDYLLNLPIDIDLEIEIENSNFTENTINDDLIIGINNNNFFDNTKECNIINLNETTVFFQDKILYYPLAAIGP